MKKKVLLQGIIVGFALFSTFFGAGNLIFPPQIGVDSGQAWWLSSIGLFLSGILLPVIAVIAVQNSGENMRAVLDPVAPWFYTLFNGMMILMLAMTSTMPKLSATTHEMGIMALTDKIPLPVTVVTFFIIVYILTSDAKSVVDKLGKYLTPALIVALLIIVVATIVNPIGTPVATGIKKPFVDAFITGYNTGDLTLGILCANLFFNALKEKGLTKEERKQGIYVTAITAILGLTIIYIGLLYLGATGQAFAQEDMSMATLLIILVEQLLGKFGAIVLAVIVMLACITTGVGIATIAGEFISEATKGKIRYKQALIIVCIVGSFLGVLGVNRIVGYASFMFAVIYPVCIVLTFLGLIRPFFNNDGAFKGGVFMAAFISFFDTLGNMGIGKDAISSVLGYMPWAELGFSWLLPSIVGIIVGSVLYKKKAE